MKILALESSAVACSACLTEDDFLIAQSYENSGMTHSVTLLPMAEELLKRAGVSEKEIDVFAVAAGPGSFTGVRIGVSACKGLAWALDKPCAKVSTLEAMAWSAAALPGILCPVMDARREQVYNALFSFDGEVLTRLTPDRAIGLEELKAELREREGKYILVGDGARLCYDRLNGDGLELVLTPPNLRYQSAWGVARSALELAKRGELVSAGELVPEYHRLSQAERERLAREASQK